MGGTTAKAADKNKSLGLTTVCIDAGHGGHDAGCISRDGKKIKEKNITLAIALKLKEMINKEYPGVKVVMTRSDDRFIELSERAAIANRNNAGLFISIHVNSLDPKNNKSWASVNGYSIHCLGQSRSGRDLYSSNMDLCRRENSVILLEDDYSTKYQGFDPNDPESYIIFNLMQNANLTSSLNFAETLAKTMAKGPITKNRGVSQDPFLVLWKTTMPAVLIECGFITNSSNLAQMSSKKGQEGIAKSIFDAFVSFKKSYDSSVGVSAPKKTTAKEEKQTVAAKEEPAAKTSAAKEEAASGEIIYGTQVLASAKKMSSSDSFFKGYTPTAVWTGKVYKYVIGTSSDKAEAKSKNAKIRKSFPESFFVVVKDGNTERVK